MFVSWKLMHDSLSVLMLESSRTEFHNSMERRLVSDSALPPSTLTAPPCHKVEQNLRRKGAGIDKLFYFMRPHMPPIIANNDCTYFSV